MPMTPQQVSDYARAAADLEKHYGPVANGQICLDALASAFAVCTGRPTDKELETRAACLLRECIARGEPLKLYASARACP
jgi:hypothetical protein